MGEIFFSSLRNISKRKSASFITFLSIFIGIMCMVIILKISTETKDRLIGKLDSMGVFCINVKANTKDYSDQVLFNDETKKSIEKSVSSLQIASPLIMNYGTVKVGKEEKNAVIIGVDYNAHKIFGVDITSGHMFTKNQTTNYKPVCVIDDMSQKNLDINNGKSISLGIGSNQHEFQVVGSVNYNSNLIENFMGDEAPIFVFMPYTTMQHFTGKYGYDRLTLKFQQNTDSQEGQEQVINFLNSKTKLKNAYKTENFQAEKSNLNGILSLVSLVLTAIGSISLVIAGFCVITLMMSNVTERTREIGIKKALGAKNSHILLEFLTECAIISFAGGFLGSLTGVIGISFAGKILGFEIPFDLNIIITSTILSIIVGIIFGTIPSLKAAKLEPISALSYEH